MTGEKIIRINELARKSKMQGLTGEEKLEQEILRKEYRESFKSNLSSLLEQCTIIDENGNKRPVKRMNDDNE